MSVELIHASSLQIKETITTGIPAATAAKSVLTQDQWDPVLPNLTGSTTPNVTKASVFELTLTAGAATINLAALTAANGVALDATGLKLIEARFSPSGTITAAMKIKKGLTNGYTGLGAAGEVEVGIGGFAHIFRGTSGVAVGAADRTLDVTGAGAEKLRCELVFGS